MAEKPRTSPPADDPMPSKERQKQPSAGAVMEEKLSPKNDPTSRKQREMFGPPFSRSPDQPNLDEFAKMQSRVMELINSGYIESVKQLRETLMIMEWDMNNKNLAKRRAVAAFERYVAEHDLLKEVGGYSVLTNLYENPDQLHELVKDEKMRMLARSMMEMSLHDQHHEMYNTCNSTAKEMASLTANKLPGGPLGQGLAGGLLQLWNTVRAKLPIRAR